MKIHLILALILVSVTFTMAQNAKPSSPQKTVITKTDTVVKYSCTMHPEILSNKPGNCSKCGMELIKKQSATAASKTTYQCPMKCEGNKVYTKAGTCPKCKMDLETLMTSTPKSK